VCARVYVRERERGGEIEGGTSSESPVCQRFGRIAKGSTEVCEDMAFRKPARQRAAIALCCVLNTLLWLRDCDAQLPHQRLGVAPNTPPADLKRAYRKRCLELHPDKHKGEAKKAWAEQEFMALGKAYETMLAEAVRRHQGASSRPTRASSGGSSDKTRTDDDRGRTREHKRTDDSRQTAEDRERAERHRREQERRTARREGRTSGWGRGGSTGSERSTAEARRQRERDREFRRMQEEERRWQEQAHKRQRQQQQQNEDSQQRTNHRHAGEEDARLRAEREQLEREERHRRERMRRQGGGKGGAHSGSKGRFNRYM